MKKLNLTNTLENIVINEKLEIYTDKEKNLFPMKHFEKTNETIKKSLPSLLKIIDKKQKFQQQIKQNGF